MSKFKDLIVTYVIPLLPGKLRLPFRYWIYSHSSSADQELLNIDKISFSFHTAVDIGAHYGLYTYRMSQIFGKVYAFEVNDELLRDLRGYGRRNIEVVNHGLSSHNGTAVLHIPTLNNGLKMTGWGSLSRDEILSVESLKKQAVSIVEKQVRVQCLDDFGLQSVDLIKIDVEGHELAVLQGAVRTLTANQPRIIIEIKERHFQEVHTFLSELRYEQVAISSLIAGSKNSEDLYIYTPQR